MNINPATITTLAGELAGIAGLVCGAVGAGNISGEVQGIITATGGALVLVFGAIAHWHVAGVAASRSLASGQGPTVSAGRSVPGPSSGGVAPPAPASNG